ncbi:hypothetical protein BN129_2956 [Cronobacter sakazakii 701]|nr:hypothetical protein BN129_2956 [Cronobacter sakazakii 701]
MKHQERRAETGREGRGRLGHAALGARQFRRKAGEEVILRLAGRQARYRRQNAERIGGQENNFRRVARFRHRLHDVIDVVNRVGDAGVFGFRGIVKIDAAVVTHGDVFQQRVAANGVIDIRLSFFGEANGFGIAAAFEVKHAVIVPAVFVIANKAAFRIGGKRRLAGAGEAKEYRYIAFFTDIRRAVHRGDAFQRQQVVHNREHAFFHLAAVPGAANQLHPFGQVKGYKVLGIQPLLLPVRVRAFRAVHHDEIRLEAFQFILGRANKHVFNEMRLPGHFGNKTHRQTAVRVSAAKSVDDEKTFTGELLRHQTFQMLPGFRRQRFVVVFAFAVIGPPQRIARGVVANNVFILRRTAGKNARVDGDRTQIRQHPALVTLKRRVKLFAIKGVVIGVINHLLDVVNTVSLEILRGYACNSHFTAP